VVFGPQPKDYSMKVNRKMRAAAMRSALSDRAGEGRIVVVDRFGFEAPKTKDAAKTLEALGVKGKSLIVIETVDMTVGRSFRNLPSVHIITVDQLNTYDILNADWIVFTQGALERVGKAAEKAAGTGGGESA